MSPSTSNVQHASGPARAVRRRRALPALEALGMFALIMLDIWLVQPHVHLAWLALVVLAIASHRLHGETLRSLGFTRTNLGACFAAVTPLLLIAAALALAFGSAFGTIRHGGAHRLTFFIPYYCVWGLFQQYVLNGYFVNRLAAAAPRRQARAVPVAAATLFALAHVPNWFLTAVTFFAGWACAHFYLEYRNLYPLGLAHGLLGSVLFITVPEPIAQRFYVGPGALKWQRAHRAAEHAGARPPGCLAALAPGESSSPRDHPFALDCGDARGTRPAAEARASSERPPVRSPTR
jgi:hypothetical protein